MTELQQAFQTANIVIPPEGPKVVPVTVQFNATPDPIDLETLLILTTGGISFIQGVYVRNETDTEFSITCSTTNQKVSWPPRSAGYQPLLAANPSTFTVRGKASSIIRPIFYNVPIQAQVYSIDNLGTSGTPIAVANTGSLFVDHSIANLSGASEALMPANSARRSLTIVNEGATPIAVNLTGGAAVLNAAGNITLAAGGSLVLDSDPPTNAITVIGTAGADVTAFEA